jgi:threonine dehydrogenase-like Zn-dependent dehydrogenase
VKTLEDAVDAWTGGAGVDLVIEATGSEPAWATATQLVRRGGVVVGLGIPGQALSLEVRRLVRGGVIVCGAYGVRRSDLERTLEFLHAHQDRAKALFDRTFPLGQGQEAFEYAAGSSGKVLLDVRR